eukprot:7642924-Heterocapsa_arctica.AAC.1
MDRTEWGGYEQIIMWDEIYQIKIEIYCCSMNMQTIDGDEFIFDKECIRLLYCDKHKWGDTENHYDLLHSIVHHTCKIKSYSRRNDLHQAEHQKQEGNKHTYRHQQTLIGEEQKSQGEQH